MSPEEAKELALGEEKITQRVIKGKRRRALGWDVKKIRTFFGGEGDAERTDGNRWWRKHLTVEKRQMEGGKVGGYEGKDFLLRAERNLLGKGAQGLSEERGS